MSVLLSAEGLEKSFGGSPVLRGVSFSVEKGEIVGIIGPNGSGKTTLTNILAGQYRPDRGRVIFDGRDITEVAMEARFRLGLSRTFQIPDPYPDLTVEEAVRVALMCGAGGGKGAGTVGFPWHRPPRPAGRAAGGRDASLEKLLGRTGLSAQRGMPAIALSQGCLRRLEFARALSCRPKLVLLDELFSALSAKDEGELAALLDGVRREDGVAVLLVTHNPHILERLCDRVLAIEDGRIVWEGTPGEFESRHPHDNGALPPGDPAGGPPPCGTP